MAGLAASFGFDAPSASAEAVHLALSRALAPRGAEAASRRLNAMSLLVRAAIPVVHEPALPGRQVALVIDGIAEASTLAGRYARSGPAGLLDPAGPMLGDHDDPYAAILMDADRNLLVLARNGDGPPLYYAQTRRAVLVASEPTALLAAGVEAAPDPTIVDRFLATGACDDTEATFFAGIRRVLPGQVVEVSRGAIRAHQVVPRRGRPSVAAALRAAVEYGRIGVRLGRGVAGAAILGTALAGRDRPLRVYSSTFPGLPVAAAEYASAVLGPLSTSRVRHRALPFFADQLDLDGFLADVGEPTPDLTSYLLWTTVKAVAGEVDAVVDPAASGCPSRLADRLASRYGVALRFPFAEAGPATRGDLVSIVDRTLPATVAHLATTPAAERATELPVRDVLARIPEELAAAFLHPRYPADSRQLLADFQALLGGRRVDTAALFRRYAVERWLRCIVEPAAAAPPPGAPVGRASARGSLEAPSPAPDPVTVSGTEWARIPVRTEVLGPGDKLAEKIAWYVADPWSWSEARPNQSAARTNLAEEQDHGQQSVSRGPWYVLVAAKPVAVAQGLARTVWQVKPGWAARVVCQLAGARTNVDSPWAAQVAIAEGGRWRMLAAAACAAVGRLRWYDRLTGPAVRSVRGPREDAVPPAHVAVVPPPADPDRLAADVVAALRNALPADAYPSFGGCAVVGVDDAGCRLLGWSSPTSTPPQQSPALLIAALCADDPFGDGSAQTPLVLAVRAPRRQPERPAGRSPVRKSKPRSARRR